MISPNAAEAGDLAKETWIDDAKRSPIDGLKVTITGAELRKPLGERIELHHKRAERWKREQARTPEEQTDDAPLLPEHMCENEAERHEWRAEVLDFLRDHIDSMHSYLLGQADLEFGELLPEKPTWLEQDEYEERTSIGFHLGRLVKSVGQLVPREFLITTPEPKAEG